jgi:hypothetical protein
MREITRALTVPERIASKFDCGGRGQAHPIMIRESLTQAARQILFIVPAGVGVQEAGLVAVGHVLGIGSDVALALSPFGSKSKVLRNWAIKSRRMPPL